MQQYQTFELQEDINPIIKKGLIGVILEIYDKGKAIEAEFVKSDGSNYEYNGDTTFAIDSSKIEINDE